MPKWETCPICKIERDKVVGQPCVRCTEHKVGIFGGFEWNSSGCCVNPEKISIELPAKFKTEVKISLALHPDGRWRYGLGVTCKYDGYTGFGCAPSLWPVPGFETKTAAIHAAVEWLKDSSYIPKEAQPLLRYTPPQKGLFDE